MVQPYTLLSCTVRTTTLSRRPSRVRACLPLPLCLPFVLLVRHVCHLYRSRSLDCSFDVPENIFTKRTEDLAATWNIPNPFHIEICSYSYHDRMDVARSQRSAVKRLDWSRTTWCPLLCLLQPLRSDFSRSSILKRRKRLCPSLCQQRTTC